ncbi:xanthine dehydrogenase accessory protein XdhC [Microbulbifer bruguierae]|uniref:Xanthine dehydrogenase accessory protein XdhC n=1 Tax=Microbulbifer bruguierae TaxID=3029061 RepID=A0ABY8N9R1_9GAMM|nr:xanthine dehydrogenase accessory protein XdhC [Microbulbifer bruguierae]WGL15174.1 xanthine dehydrogenase accessory protein XdhC [Microbulbifer bruguierae]
MSEQSNGFNARLGTRHWASAAAGLEQLGRAYVLITILGVRGSTPREDGTKMLVSADDQGDLQCEGTIGGGHLEYRAIERATALLAEGRSQQALEHFPLGAKLGQCCGGSVAVLFEMFAPAGIDLMLFGAGHVGRALVKLLEDLPCRVRWVDSRAELLAHSLPANVASNITTNIATNVITVATDDPVAAVADMPAQGYYLVLTHNHQLDFEITRAILQRGDAHYVGLIGSETKWRRFRMRFEHRGHPPAFYQPVHCPVGLSAVPGKRPMEVAVSIAGEIIGHYQRQHRQQSPRTVRRGLGWSELESLVRDTSAAAQAAADGATLEADQ